MPIRIFCFFLLLPFSSCLTGPEENKSVLLFEDSRYHFPYQLNSPDKTWILPTTLNEISGLSFVDDQRLACVQDESGKIFIFNVETGKIEKEISFGDRGDYEGIEIFGNDAWILKSNGTLYEVKDYQDEAALTTTEHNTPLSARNDTEGLAYDPADNCLFIACKEQPLLKENEGKGFRAIYRYNLETRQLNPEPYIMISLDSIRYYRSLNARFLTGGGSFQPSGIALHPVTGEIYILGSVGKLLLVLSTDGKILASVKLMPGIFPKPEGICFSPYGKLFISTEGDGKAGKIMEFHPDQPINRGK
jgi:uncharacterized protein YjiK